MQDQVLLVAGVTLLGLLEQAYFSLQVIYARRKYSVSPPQTSGPPEFERIYRAQANCSEYFPIFTTSLWLCGIFTHQGVTAALGLLYLYGRYQYFWGYAASPLNRLKPLYFSANVLWALIGLASLGVLASMSRFYLGFQLHHFTFLL